jgi:hypothetical protein
MDALREGDVVEVPKPRGMALTDVGVGFDVADNSVPEGVPAGDATVRPPGFLEMRDVTGRSRHRPLRQHLEGDYDYGMPACAAAMIALVRMLRHLGYPAAIWFVLVANRDVVPDLVFVLLCGRQALHILTVLACACVNPAFLLVDVGASVKYLGADDPWHGGYIFLAMYVVAPEKFVALALFEKGGLDIGLLAKEPRRAAVYPSSPRLLGALLGGGGVVLCSTLLDLCGLAALAAGLGAGNLPPALVVGYSAIALSAVWTARVYAAWHGLCWPAERVHASTYATRICQCTLSAFCLLLALMVLFALGAGWIGGDDASGRLSGSTGGPAMDVIEGIPREPNDEEDPGFLDLSGVPTWLVTICTVAAIGGCCVVGLAVVCMNSLDSSASMVNGGLMGGLMVYLVGLCGAVSCVCGVVVVVLAGAVTSGDWTAVGLVVGLVVGLECMKCCCASRAN